MEKHRRRFLWCHAALLLSIPLFFLYRFVMTLLPRRLSGCILHDFLFLYCPVCGGTRALSALLRLDLLAALRYNAFVVFVFFVFLVLDGIAWARFFQKRTPLFRISAPFWICAAVLLVAFGVLRNYLMIAHGIDPIGDLLPLWQVFLS